MTWPPSGPPRGGQRDAVGGYLPEVAEKCREGGGKKNGNAIDIEKSLDIL